MLPTPRPIPVTKADLPALLSGAEVFAFPSLYEGFGLPPLEALACGAAVLCGETSSLPEVVGAAALRVDTRSAAALAAGLARLLGDAALRQQLRAAGPARAARFSWQSTAEATLAVYQEIPEDLLERVEDVLFNRRPDSTERLVEAAEQVKGSVKSAAQEDDWRNETVEQRLSHALIKGIVDYIEPDLEEASLFAEAVHEKYPGKLLAYNCSPSFNWKKKLDEATIARFREALAEMGYKFQFITLAGFHSLNLSMFELAREYKLSGMTAYSQLQQAEFQSEREHGYEAVKHQRFVGTGYFDLVTQIVSGGASSTTALTDSTEAEQFVCPPAPVPSLAEEMLLPSGD